MFATVVCVILAVAVVVLSLLLYRVGSGREALSAEPGEDVDDHGRTAGEDRRGTAEGDGSTSDLRASEGMEPATAEEVIAVTRQAMFETLVALHCQPELIDDDQLAVEFQGEVFHMHFWGRFASIWDLGWLYVREDEPELPLLRKAVNGVNFRPAVTVVVSDPDESGMVRFHSRRDILLLPDYPENEEYVRSTLLSFFRTKELLRDGVRELREGPRPSPEAFKPSEN